VTGLIDPWAEILQIYRSGSMDQAEEMIEALLEARPRHVPAMHLLGVIAYRRRDLLRSIQLMKAVLEVDPSHIGALNGVAMVLGETGRASEALPYCLLAVQIRPSYGEAHNTVGMCELAAGQVANAVKSFRTALKFAPGLRAAEANLEIALSRLAGQVAPDSEPVLSAEEYVGLGFAHLHAHRRKEAIDAFAQAVALAPGRTEYVVHLAEAKRLSGDVAGAEEILNRAALQNPSSPVIHARLGYIDQDMGRFVLAKARFQRSLELQPAQGDAYLGFATSGRADESDRWLLDRMESLLEEPGLVPADRVLLLTAMSKMADDLKDYEGAMRSMDRGNELSLSEVAGTPRFDRKAFERRIEETRSVVQDRKCGLPHETPVFIVGLPRSGTTLVEQIVSRHPYAAAGGELRFWSDADAKRPQGLNELADRPEELLALAGNYLKLLLGRLDLAAERVTDKLPANFMYIGLLNGVLPEARFIHCRRGPRDNGVSLYMTPFRRRPSICHRREDIVAYYRGYKELMDHWQATIPADRLLTIDYESLVADPETSARRMMKFLDLPWDDRCLETGADDGPVGTASNWQARQPVYQTSVDRWRRYEPWLGDLASLPATVA